VAEIKKIYLMHFFAGLSTAASVTFTLYFLAHGLTQTQIGQLFGIFMIALAIFDIPTGGIADMFGHKASVVIGLAFQGVSFLLFFLAPTYPGFLLGMLSAAIGLAFQSGATSSLIYELLYKDGCHEEFQKVVGKANGYFLIASIIASPVGSFMYTYYPQLPYLLSFLVFIPATLFVSFIKWEFVKKPLGLSAYIQTIRNGIRLTGKNTILMATVMIGIALTVNRLVFNQNISQPYTVSVGVDVAYLGLLVAGISAIQALVSIHAYKLSQKIGMAPALVVLIAVPGISVIALSFIDSLLAIPIIIIFCMGHALRDPVLTHITQEHLDPDKRSTMASTISFLVSVVAGILMIAWGKGIDVLGMSTTLYLLGGFTLFIGAVGLLLYL
jgi:MFS family permease